MLRVHEKTVSVRRPAVLKRPCAHLPSKDCTCNSLGSVPPFCTSPAKPRLALSASKTMVHHATLPIRFAASNRYDQPGESTATQCNTMLRVSRRTVSVREQRDSQRPCAHRPSKKCTCNSLGSVPLFCTSPAKPRPALSASKTMVHHATPCNTMSRVHEKPFLTQAIPEPESSSATPGGPAQSIGGDATKCYAYTKKL
jgi:hypothetical protein